MLHFRFTTKEKLKIYFMNGEMKEKKLGKFHLAKTPEQNFL